MYHALLALVPLSALAQSPPQMVPIRPGTGPKRTLDQKRDLQVLRRVPTESERKLAQCKATKGAWVIEIRGISLSAKGSDVDEIYGHISVSTSDGGVVRQLGFGQYWNKDDIYASAFNVDLGRYPVTWFPRVQVTNLSGAERHNARVWVRLAMFDEDGKRGGSDDDRYIVRAPLDSNLGPNNSVEHVFVIPDCDELPEFRFSTSHVFEASPLGQATKNTLIFRYSVTAFRTFS